MFVMAAFFMIAAAGPAQAKAPSMHGRAAVLIDGNTGQVLFNQNMSVANYPASTTKLLTALVAVEHGNLDQMITVSPQAVALPPDSSSCYLNAGETQSLSNLLYGLLLASGNDCAMAIAEGVGNGHVDQFVAWMNETAKRVGATHSHFANPHGLHDPEHYTTALDLALIARAAFANPTIQKIASTREFNWPGKEQNGTYYNHDSMLFTYDGTIGGKTGYTEEAGLTLVNAAKRGDRYVIGVVMGEADKTTEYNDMTALLDHGFDDFDAKTAVTAGTVVGSVAVAGGQQQSVPVIAKSDVTILVPAGTDPDAVVTPKLDAQAQAPVQPGQKLGTVEIRAGGQVIGVTEADAQLAVAVMTPWAKIALGHALAVIKWLIAILAALLVFRTVVQAIRRLRRRSARRSRYRSRTGFGMASARNRGQVNLYRMRNK